MKNTGAWRWLGTIRRQWRDLVALALFAALSAGMLSDVLFHPRSLSGFDVLLSHSVWNWQTPYRGMHQPLLLDSPTAHYPERKLNQNALLAGRNLPYNPYGFAGYPWNSQGAGAFVTSMWQLFVDLPSAIDWSTWLRLLLAGFFMYLFLKDIGLGRWACLLGGVVWAFNLHHLVWLTFPQHLATQLWIPLLLLFNLRILRHGCRSVDVVGLVVVNALMVTSGYQQAILYTYLFIGLFNTVYLLATSDPWRLRLRRWLSVHALFIAAAIVVLPTVLQDAVGIAEGLRGIQFRSPPPPAIDIDQPVLALLRSLLPTLSDLNLFLAPNIDGGLWGTHYVGERNIIEAAGYFGALAVFLLLFALVRYRSAPVRPVLMATALTTLALFTIYHHDRIALGALNLIPFADRGGYQRAVLSLMIFSAALLAAHGLHALIGDLRRGTDRAARWLLAALILTPMALWLTRSDVEIAPFGYALAVLCISAAILILACTMPRLRRWLAPAFLIVAAADLFGVGYHFNTRVDNHRIFPTNDLLRFLQADPEPLRVAQLSHSMSFHPNALSWYAIPEVGGYLTVAPRRYLQLVAGLFDDYALSRNGILFIFSDADRALRMLAVRYVIVDRQLDDDVWELMLINDHRYLYRLRDPLERVYCASDRIVVTHELAVPHSLRSALDTLDRPMVVVGEETGNEALTSECTIDDIEVYTTGVTFRANTTEETFVLVPYNHSRGWRAFSNSERTPLIQANHSLMAVAIPPGETDVLIRYRHPFEHWQALAFLLLLGAIAAATATGRLRGMTATVWLAVTVVITAKTALSLPGIGNERVPERTAIAPDRAPETVGLRRDERATPSPRVTRERPYHGTFEPDLDALTAFRFYLGTYGQRRLPYDLTVEVRDEQGALLVNTRISGEQVHDNEFVRIDLPLIEHSAGRRFHWTLLPDNDHEHLAFAVWLDDTGEPLLATFHDAARVHGYTPFAIPEPE